MVMALDWKGGAMGLVLVVTAKEMMRCFAAKYVVSRHLAEDQSR